jgi:4-hydroxy-tetrahydrodipicolinate reductase
MRARLAHEAAKGATGAMTSIVILGASGRMGRAIADAAAQAGVTVAENEAGDVLVDFTSPDALQANLAAAVGAGTPIVIGTTGLGADHHRAIDDAATSIPVLQTANTSLGVNLLAGLVEEAARRLGPDWDIGILDMHHRHKADAPSGTALLLGAAAQAGRDADVDYASLRGGSVAGDHLVIFAGDGEWIELGHRAESRAIFAKGAVKAALWLQGKPAGRYTMADVLGTG